MTGRNAEGSRSIGSLRNEDVCDRLPTTDLSPASGGGYSGGRESDGLRQDQVPA
jgi:hypothetical protein